MAENRNYPDTFLWSQISNFNNMCEPIYAMHWKVPLWPPVKQVSLQISVVENRN
jgi:hypothetical protein